MNLGEFKDLLRGSIKRGDSMDGKLDGYIRRAARFIENNWTFQYMRRRFTLQSVAGDVTIDLPPNVPIKAVEYLRFDGADGTRYEMVKGDLSDESVDWNWAERYSAQPNYVGVMPSHFYMDGVVALVFNRAFPEVLGGVGLMAQYTDFPRKDSDRHWLIDNAEGLLLRQSMVEFMTDTRDDRGAQAMLAKREEDLRALMNADFEARYTGQNLSLGV